MIRITYNFTCKQAFGIWAVSQPDEIKKRRCLWGCTCNGKGIRLTERSRVVTDDKKV